MTTSQSLAFSQVDVFASASFQGNPVAVVHNADDLSDDAMAAFARWTNLSETTFLLQPTSAAADYRLRIFTPGGELPFAGHPTLGSCHAWLEAGGRAKSKEYVLQECAAGLIRIRTSAGKLAFAAPPLLRTGPIGVETLNVLSGALGLATEHIVGHQWVDNGPGWCALMLDSAQRVLSVTPNFQKLAGVNVGLVGPYPSTAECDFEVRAFVPDLGVPEDPVTGSLNAGIAQWLMTAGLAPDNYVASQGTAVKRAGRVYLDRENRDIWVGGDVCVRLRGEARFDV